MWFFLRNALKNYLKIHRNNKLENQRQLFHNMSSSLKVFQLQTVDLSLEHNLLVQFP